MKKEKKNEFLTFLKRFFIENHLVDTKYDLQHFEALYKYESCVKFMFISCMSIHIVNEKKEDKTGW